MTPPRSGDVAGGPSQSCDLGEDTHGCCSSEAVTVAHVQHLREAGQTATVSGLSPPVSIRFRWHDETAPSVLKRDPIAQE